MQKVARSEDPPGSKLVRFFHMPNLNVCLKSYKHYQEIECRLSLRMFLILVKINFQSFRTTFHTTYSLEVWIRLLVNCNLTNN